MNKTKLIIWSLWLIVTVSVASFFAYKMFVAEDKSELLIGDATHGHYQIEMACITCHTDAFGGEEVLQNACTSCHQEELKAAHDSHPKKKFTDPRNADRLEILDARYCVTCHTEHQNEQTHPMGVTIPDDYCYHCHQEVGEERESHKDLPFDSCSSAGCHNYHDNRALYERFLVENSEGPWLNAMARIAGVGAKTSPHAIHPEYSTDSEQPKQHPEMLHPEMGNLEQFKHWDDNFHFKAGVGCVSCHQADKPSETQWLSQPGPSECQACHSQETEGYFQGKHGMRLAQGLSPLTPAQSQLAFDELSFDKAHTCTSCHQSQTFGTQFPAVQACLGCHADEHSLAFEQSPHGKLAAQVDEGLLPADQSVTCATCHMPRLIEEKHGKESISVQHNQNDNLRPNEKMIRPVCMSCHSLEFSIDALADEDLIKNNFKGQPKEHIPSIDWAVKREKR